mgnify:CR=1 FL=1
MDLKEKILVTGADGFIGSHLTELLLYEGYSVRALSQYNSFNYHGWLEDIKPDQHLEIISGDIRDPRMCDELVKGTSLVFHLASLIAIPYSYHSPDSYVDTNIKGTLNICQAARANGNTPVIHTSTSEVYGTAQYVPIDEKHPRQAQSPYSASKIGADAIAMSFWHSFGLPVTIARPFNTYGPRQSARAIIPTIISQIASGAPEVRVGNLTPTRDMNYVSDTSEGLLAVARCIESVGREVNICSGNENSMHDIINVIIDLMGAQVDLVSEEQRVRPETSEVFRLCGDNRLIRELTGWKPKHDLQSGLEKTIAWFLMPENLKKYKADRYNI